MKRLAFLISLSLAVFTIISCSPNPKKILEGSYEKCQSIKNGYYEMENYWKMMSRNDTMRIIQKSHFRKIDNDSVLPFIFNSYLESQGMGEINLLYTGENLVMYSGNNGHITQREDNGSNVWMLYNKNAAFNSYLPITYKDSKPIPSPLALSSEKFVTSYVKQEQINGIQCYHIKAIVPEEFDCSVLQGYGLIIRTEFNYWISKQDSIPMQITVSRDLKVGNDTLVEFEKFVLTKYELNTFPNDTLFMLQSLSDNVNLQPSKPYVKKELLKTGDIAPNWSLPSMNGDTLALSYFRGDLILMDFFFVSCPPCIEILPSLQSFHKKYKEQGLNIVGIDRYDSQKTLEYFIALHGIDYPILLDNWETGDAYNITGYPTTYLISREGKILFSHCGGYDHAALERLDYIIQQHVK